MKLIDITEQMQQLTEMAQDDITEIQTYLNGLFAARMNGMRFELRLHATDDRLRDGERESHVTKEMFIDAIETLVTDKKYRGMILGARQDEIEFNGIVQDKRTNLNIPFAINYRESKNGLPIPYPQFRFKVTTIKSKNINAFKPNKLSDVVFVVPR
jgi:hypothetical protein